MDEMGFKNTERVYDMARRGVFSKPNGDSSTVNLLALNMMLYMSLKAVSAEDQKAINDGKAYWCYWGGWEKMAANMGLTVTPMEIGDNEADIAVDSKKRTAINRLSRTAKFLQEKGAIKLLRPSSTIGTKRNATWLLLLGDEAENAAAEAHARECLGLSYC